MKEGLKRLFDIGYEIKYLSSNNEKTTKLKDFGYTYGPNFDKDEVLNEYNVQLLDKPNYNYNAVIL